MSTEAEVIEFEGKRYRVAGKSGPGAEPKVGMVVRWDSRVFQRITAVDHEIEFHTGLRVNGHRQGGNWSTGAYEILALAASPPAETPRCEAPGWCGLPYLDYRVPFAEDYPKRFTPCCQSEPGGILDQEKQCNRRAKCEHSSYCSTACADRARAAAGGEPSPGGGSRKTVPDAPASPIPAGYRLAKGWEVLKMPGWFNGDAWFCFAADADDCPGGNHKPALLANRRDRIGGACLDCAERRGAIERVEALEDAARTMAKTARETADRIAVGILNDAFTRAYPPAPCLSHHPELGSRCERKDPHDNPAAACWGYRPGTGERVTWARYAAKAETRAERWRRTHPGYAPDGEYEPKTDYARTVKDRMAQSRMYANGFTTGKPTDVLRQSGNLPKPAPWTPSDPEADIPWVWER